MREKKSKQGLVASGHAKNLVTTEAGSAGALGTSAAEDRQLSQTEFSSLLPKNLGKAFDFTNSPCRPLLLLL